MAAAGGEEAKDNQYLDSVSKSSGDFIPLICESFGVWTPYALSTLFSIADRSTGQELMVYFCNSMTL